MKMRKVAFFVEGLTEMLFVNKLLVEIVNKKKYALKTQRMRGGARKLYELEVISEDIPDDQTECFVLITECGGDSTVKSYMLEQRQSLIRSGYSMVVGIVDLFPKTINDLHMFKMGLNLRVPQMPIPMKFVIPLLEIESWFLADHNHVTKIDPILTKEKILDSLQMNLEEVIVEDIIHPSADLHRIYQLAGKSYIKKRKSLQRTVDVLDYANIYFELPKKIQSLKDLMEIINNHVLID